MVRPRNLFDNAVPSGTSVAIDWLLRLAVVLGEERYEAAALAALRPMADLMQRYPSGFGRYLSALHRAKNLTVRERLSMVLFLDPAFDAKLEPLPGVVPDSDHPHTNVRWDRIDPHALQGTYGEYLLSKVSKVFPELAPTVR